MNLTQELINTLQGIHDGKPWQWRKKDSDEWHESIGSAGENFLPLKRACKGFEIRLKPEPDPYAEAKAAWRDGELQFRCRGSDIWVDWPERSEPLWFHPPSRYRRKPKPIRVPLGPEDVPPGSVFRSSDQSDTMFWVVSQVWRNGFYLRGESVDWGTAKERMEINRSLPLTGKWDAAAWEPCWKEVQS